MRVMILIPAYNEGLNIRSVICELHDVCPKYDYLVLNDGSDDDTREICKSNKYPFLDLPINVGLSACFQAGVIFAYNNGYDAVLQLDGDGQHNPVFIKNMVELMEQTGCDIVIGSRFVENNECKMEFVRRVGSNVLRWCIFLTTFKKISDPTSGMRLYNRKIMDDFRKNSNYHPEPDTLSFLLSKGASVREVQVEMRERQHGTSYLNALNSVKYMIKMCVSILVIQAFR